MATRSGIKSDNKDTSSVNPKGRIRYWLSFDLGLTGDFTGLYQWLDEKRAEECGIGVATFFASPNRDQVIHEIRELTKSIPRARLYLISVKQGGRFIFGGRKSAPWEGYAITNATMADEK